jgi:hypothetical protein
MTSNSTTPSLPQSEIETAEHLFDNWFDPIETGLRDRVREFLELMFEGELRRGAVAAALSAPRRARGSRPNGSPPRPPTAITAGKLWPSYDPGAAREIKHSRRRNDGMEEPSTASLPAAHACGRRVDCKQLPGWHQYPSRAPCAPSCFGGLVALSVSAASPRLRLLSNALRTRFARGKFFCP